MRLFIGIALAQEAEEALARVRKRFETAEDGLRWSRPESWHVTLQFLGSASEAQAECVRERLAMVRAGAVPIRVEGLGFFERAGVFWGGVPLTPQLLALQQFVTAATRICGFEPEDRAYNPHITLARVTGRGRAKALAALRKTVERATIEVKAEFTATEFLLYESVPERGGSRYEVRARFPLMAS